ncbi:MAG: LysR family transcriptional regulator [Acidobacteriaceae bacterium]|nr:LysR family transcriptional regulator [Acidobacteriaceae bacterium]
MENFRLRVFRSVAHHLNFRAAAEQLRLTQPAVTQQIKTLEEELDTALFLRTAGKVSLTPAGEALLPYAERLAQTAENAREAVAAAEGRSAGRLTLAASQTIAQYLLPHLLAGFLREHPHVEIVSQTGNTHEALATLAEHKAQLALIEGPALRQDVQVRPFMTDHMLLIVPPDHAWAGSTITVAQLREAPLLLRERGSGSRRIVEQALESAGIKARELNPRMTFDSTEALLAAVEAGLGVAFVSQWAVRTQLQLGTLQSAKVQGLRLERSFSIARLSGPEPTGVLGSFSRFVLEQGAAFDHLLAKSKSSRKR